MDCTLVALTDRDLDAIARVADSEVESFRTHRYPDWEGAVRAIADTIINRTASKSFPKTVSDVVNAKGQFSAVSGNKYAVGTWDKLREAHPATVAVVANWAVERANGGPSSIGGALNFLNPNESHKGPMESWGQNVVDTAVAVFGRGKDVHYHGTAPGLKPVEGWPTLSPELEEALGEPVYDVEAFRWRKAGYRPWTPDQTAYGRDK